MKPGETWPSTTTGTRPIAEPQCNSVKPDARGARGRRRWPVACENSLRLCGFRWTRFRPSTALISGQSAETRSLSLAEPLSAPCDPFATSFPPTQSRPFGLLPDPIWLHLQNLATHRCLSFFIGYRKIRHNRLELTRCHSSK